MGHWFDFKEALGFVPKKFCPFCRRTHGVREVSIDDKGDIVALMRCDRFGMVEIRFTRVEKWSWKP